MRLPSSVFRLPFSVFRFPSSVFRFPSSVFCLLSLTATLALAACSSGPPRGEARQIPPPPDVAAAPADAVRTPTNITSKVITPGSGTRHPRPNSTVTVHYT